MNTDKLNFLVVSRKVSQRFTQSTAKRDAI